MNRIDTTATLHLRCGSDIRDGLKEAGFVGNFLEFSDPFCQGPVPDQPLGQFIKTRATFIAGAYELSLDDVLARCQREYGALATLGNYEHVVLWFEHDSYDQLILAFLMDYIATSRPDTRIEVISLDHAPGIERFTGLGQLAPDGLIWVWENHRMTLSDDMIAFGKDAWQAIRATDPALLTSLANRQTAPLPHMPAALKRHLAEFPAPDTGLGLTQKQTLQIIADHGPLPLGKVFGHLMRSYEPLPYLGDLMFWAEVKLMTECKNALFTLSPANADQIWAERTITLTETGKDTLLGKRNFLDNFLGTRWVGGIRTGQPFAP
ncbi:DUF1835 domain-containing protein [Thalassospira australica]|uniref:DUF1835 domain-containing protein n=1 Tax=Thalassospira australica TaxID=1528106 RepID=UPI00068AFEA4|nr:DUF1835 domain-containing protein [Thalassospira australica]